MSNASGPEARMEELVAENERLMAEVRQLKEQLEDLRSMYDLAAQVGSKAVKFRLDDDLHIETRGTNLWAVTRGNGHYEVLNKDGAWEFEPLPSSRSEDFIARTRFRFSDAWGLAQNELVNRSMNSLSPK